MHKVYITGKVPDLAANLLRKSGFEVISNLHERILDKNELKEVFATYEAVLTQISDKIDEDVIASASGNLKIISNYAVGFDNIDVLFAKRHGIVVANTPGVAGESVAEHTFSLILALKKRLIETDRFVRRGKFHKWDPMAFLSNQLSGATIGIVGLGGIGTCVGHIAGGGFKMKILYHDLVRSEDFEMLSEAKFTILNHLLKEADIITLHVPLTPATHHLIGKQEFAIMKNSAVLVNTSRGPVVDEKALVWALSQGKIAAAGLDVFEHEPHVSHELLTMPNVILTPHIASATYQTRDAMAKIAAQNIIDVFSGKTPHGLVKVS